MRPGAHYDVEFENFGKHPTRSVFRSVSEAEVLTFSSVNLKPESELFVACIREGVDFGNFIVEVDAQARATVIAHEHRGFIADGLTMEAAINALKYWLPVQSRTPEIHWEDQ
ncbi:hypothetical protein AAKU55_005662 [Oxalobacteraceae bacterium GrIS 1.11]